MEARPEDGAARLSVGYEADKAVGALLKLGGCLEKKVVTKGRATDRCAKEAKSSCNFGGGVGGGGSKEFECGVDGGLRVVGGLDVVGLPMIGCSEEFGFGSVDVDTVGGAFGLKLVKEPRHVVVVEEDRRVVHI